MGLGYLSKLIDPTTNVVEYIETKLHVPITFISSKFQFITEVQARELRVQAHSEPLLPVANDSDMTFHGQGQLLGRAEA